MFNRPPILVLHGPEDSPKHELLAWLRGPLVREEAITVGEFLPSTQMAIDERVTRAIAAARKGIALITPDPRVNLAPPLNVIDEIGRWRGAGRESDLAILWHKGCQPIYSNLSGIVRIEFASRVHEAFEGLRHFLGVSLSSRSPASSTLQCLPIREILKHWRSRSDIDSVPLFLVVGGAEKYDPTRKALGMQEYQSTEPITGVVRLAVALSATSNFVDAVCDYDGRVRHPKHTPIDVVLVGAGDTNRFTREVFVQDASALPVRFLEPTGSTNIVDARGHRISGRPESGLLLALKNPLPGIRHALVAAGNGARGTNAALAMLTSALKFEGEQSSLFRSEAIVTELQNDVPHAIWHATR